MYLTNVNETSNGSSSFVFGIDGDVAFGGDPDRDGRDTVFLYRPATGLVYFTNDSPAGHGGVALTAGSLHFGVPTDRFIVGDWDGDGDDTVAVFRPGNTTTYISNVNTTAWAADSWVFGEPDWLPVAGHY